MDHSTCNVWFYNYVIKNVQPNIVCMYNEIHFVMKNVFTSYILEVLQKRQLSMQSDMIFYTQNFHISIDRNENQNISSIGDASVQDLYQSISSIGDESVQDLYLHIFVAMIREQILFMRACNFAPQTVYLFTDLFVMIWVGQKLSIHTQGNCVQSPTHIHYQFSSMIIRNIFHPQNRKKIISA